MSRTIAPPTSQQADCTSAQVFAAVVMDRSASMERFRDVPRRALNDYIEKLKQSQHADVLAASVVVFDHATDTLIPLRPLAKIRSVPEYANGRGTRLHGTTADVIERLIERVLRQQGRGLSVSASVTVFTDGEDTSKPRGKHLNRLHRAVIEASELGFQLIAVGIGIAGAALARELWFPERLAITVDPDGCEILKAAEDVSEMVKDFSAALRASELPRAE
jgi:hypothetical protein